MSRHNDLVSRLARIERGLEDQRFVEYVADRIELLQIAQSVIAEMEMDEPAVYDVVTVARFLAGEEES